MNLRRRIFLAAALASAVPVPGRASAQGAPVDGMRFSALRAGATLPADMKPWAFGGGRRPTRYSLVADEGVVVLRADAESSASGIVREVRVDPREHPMIDWRWKIMGVLKHADLRTREGDDFAARVYVTFDLDPGTLPAADRLRLSLARLAYGDKVPAAALCYVWDGRSPRDTLAPNAYTDRVRMIVAESGAARSGQWVSVRRNLREDYRRAFGAEAGTVNGVIVSTDTDNTGESAEAYYGDISFGAR